MAAPQDVGVETGVGLTALMVAAARAIETHRDDTLAQDDYAEHFVRAAGTCANWPLRVADVPDGDANPLWGRLARYFGLRTRVFDDHLLGSGAHQVVLLEAGFDPTTPSAWLAEGLFLYLPTAAERRVVDAVDRLTAAGSTLAFEVKQGVESAAVRGNPVYTATKAQIGVDLLGLFDPGPRPDSAAELTSRGWSTTSHTAFEFTRRHGRGPEPEPDDTLAANRWTFATKPPRP